jgi:coatomer protein complex subunit alpha (xenin)
VAAGEFGEAFNLLERRIGLMNAEPLQPLFLRAYAAAQTGVPGLPATPGVQIPLLAAGSLRDRACSPFLLCSYGSLQEQQKEAAKLFTKGAFADALKAYRLLLQSLVLAVAASAEEDQGLQDLFATSAQYVTALRLETSRKALPEADAARGVELVAYLTCCKLAPTHMTLTLQVGMTTAFKAQNYLTAAYFAKRLLQGKAPPELQTKARKVLQVCESKATDAVAINFDQRAAGPDGNLTLCSRTFKPIPPSAAVVLCPFCSSSFLPDAAGSLCDVCGLAKVGASTLGVQFRLL